MDRIPLIFFWKMSTPLNSCPRKLLEFRVGVERALVLLDGRDGMLGVDPLSSQWAWGSIVLPPLALRVG